MKESFKSLFTPNVAVSTKRSIQIIIVEFLLLLFVWNWNKSAHLPGPLDVVHAIPRLFTEYNFLDNLLTSFFLSLAAIFFSSIFALLISYLSQIPVGRPIAVLTTKFRFSAFSGFLFMFFLMFPSGFLFKCFSLAFAVVPWVVTGNLTEFNDIEKMRYTHLRTLGISEWKIMRELIVYGKFNTVLELIRQNYAMVWMMIATVEGVYISEGGIGASLEMFRKYLSHLPDIMAIQIIVVAMAIVTDFGMSKFIKMLTPWAYLKNERQ